MILIIFVFGLCIGSFLNVCIYRVPEGKSIISPGSACTQCGYFLKWYDLIPVVSFLLLGGKCRKCKAEISMIYPFIEMLTGAIFVIIYLIYGFSLESIALLCLSPLLICISFIDLKHKIIPNSMVLIILVLGIAYSLLNNNISILDSVIGFFAASLPMFLLALASHGGMGGGDIKLMAVIGVFFGWKIAILSLLIGALIGTIVSLVFILFKKATRKSKIPFGPFLSLGILISAIWGEMIINWYLTISGLI